ncbi:semaphorin-2A-like isoform X2 [Limulus polyphemus]|nr:semaphorin-2A-like isoform X2 [Limulus polyphemus]
MTSKQVSAMMKIILKNMLDKKIIAVIVIFLQMGTPGHFLRHPDFHTADHRHHKDYPHVFNCGKFYYRTFYMDKARDVLFVGGMDKIYALPLSNINITDCE